MYYCILLVIMYWVIRSDCRGLTTCHTQYTSDSNICIFVFNGTTLQDLLHTLQALYMCTLRDSTGLFKIIVWVLTTCHTQYT